MTEWIRRPRQSGWYWHKFDVDDTPIYNMCCVSIVGEKVYVHYLGELSQQIFQRNDIDSFWGPLKPPA